MGFFHFSFLIYKVMIKIIEKIQVKLWLKDHWVKFKIEVKAYDNIMTFFQESKIFFVTNMILDFTSIPIELHGYGHSNNLLEYLANNNNNSLVSSFLTYFFNNILKISYLNNISLYFNFNTDEKWQNIQIIINPITSISYLTVDTYLITSDSYDTTCDQIQI